MKVIFTLFWMIIGYLAGSFSWSLFLGKRFFHKDIRNYGSKNLGGTNAGRVLGSRFGLLIIVLDMLKPFLIMAIAHHFVEEATLFAGFAVAIGHCYPLFADFKGGKAVASSYGFLLGVGCFVTGDPIFSFVYPCLIFLIILGLFRYVSLASMVALLMAALIGFLTFRNTLTAIFTLLLALLVIYRHLPNIRRLIQKKENKISFLI